MNPNATSTAITTITNNYYPALDALSPAATYSLGGLAMILGIIGAVLIMREPRKSEKWNIAYSSLQEF